MIVVPAGSSVTLEWRTYAPPTVAGGDRTAEDATHIVLTITAPDGTESTVEDDALTRPVDEDDEPITGLYHHTMTGTEGVWSYAWTWNLEGGECGVGSPFHVRFR